MSALWLLHPMLLSFNPPLSAPAQCVDPARHRQRNITSSSSQSQVNSDWVPRIPWVVTEHLTCLTQSFSASSLQRLRETQGMWVQLSGNSRDGMTLMLLNLWRTNDLLGQKLIEICTKEQQIEVILCPHYYSGYLWMLLESWQCLGT